MENYENQHLNIDLHGHAEACAYLEAAMATLECGISAARQDIIESKSAIFIDGDAASAILLLAQAGQKIMSSGKVGFLDVIDAFSSMIHSVEIRP